MAEYGISMAQDGAAIATASDYQRILDTRWKTVSIVASIPINNALLYGSEILKLYDHNLGYLPAFDVPYFNTRYEQQSTASGSYVFVADRTSIYFVNKTGPLVYTSNPYTFFGNVNVYDLNMEENFDSPPKGLASPATKSTRGIKIIGNDDYAADNAADSDPLGFAVTTEAKAFGVSKINEFTISGGTASLSHDLGYPPLIKVASTNHLDLGPFPHFPAPAPSPGPFIGPLVLNEVGTNLVVEASTNLLTITSSIDATYRYVIFREPVELAA